MTPPKPRARSSTRQPAQSGLDGLRQVWRAAQSQAATPPKPPPKPAPVETDAALFRSAVGGVAPVRHERAETSTPPPEAVPRQRERDEHNVLAEAMSDFLDVDHLLETDETLSWRQPGIGQDVLRKLRRGHWSLQGELDLHGLRSDDAREALGEFLRHAMRREWRCVRVIHGKGLGSPNREPVLKAKVRRWLVQRDDVLAFVQARPTDGGAGAVVVLLRPARRGSGDSGN